MRKTINIYLTKEERKKVDLLKAKYHLSLTTIVDVLCDITEQTFFLNCDENLYNDLKNRHWYALVEKTSIKEPKLFSKKIRGTEQKAIWEESHKTRFANNVLHIYLYKEIGKFIQHQDLLNGKYGYWNNIEKELNKRVDNFWQYNEHIRLQRRMLKENRNYFKKEIERMEK